MALAQTFGRAREEARGHGSIVWALLMRELATRYGRSNIGFLWVVGEPLLFCLGVLALWSVIKPPYEHGLRILPFVITGYMPIILVRHMVQQAVNCVRANTALLYHRQITVIHLFAARLLLEFVGVTMAFFVVCLVLGLFGQVTPPARLELVYGGWFLLAWLAAGLALVVGALSQIVEVIERFVSLMTYVLVPLSGTFYMAAWLPAAYRDSVLLLPLLHPVEMIRAGFFGDSVPTYYSLGYAAAWAAGLTLTGLLLLRFVRRRIEVE
jgi:capsular polysaccharide transport system permease protein